MNKIGIKGTINEIWCASGYSFSKIIFSQENRRWSRLACGEVLGKHNIESIYDLHELYNFIANSNKNYVTKTNNTKTKELFLSNNKKVMEGIEKLIAKKEKEGEFKIQVSGLWQKTTLEFWYTTTLPKAFDGIRV